MAQVQTVPELNMKKLVSEETDLLSFTMQALQLVNPWRINAARVHEYSSPVECEENPRERTITLNEVSNHDSPCDCWVIIYDRVYDITSFMDEHPGGAEIMMEYAGRDASTAFRGSGHSRNAVKALDRFLVGELPMHERIYRKPGGIKLSDMQE